MATLRQRAAAKGVERAPKSKGNETTNGPGSTSGYMDSTTHPTGANGYMERPVKAGSKSVGDSYNERPNQPVGKGAPGDNGRSNAPSSARPNDRTATAKRVPTSPNPKPQGQVDGIAAHMTEPVEPKPPVTQQGQRNPWKAASAAALAKLKR